MDGQQSRYLAETNKDRKTKLNFGGPPKEGDDEGDFDEEELETDSFLPKQRSSNNSKKGWDGSIMAQRAIEKIRREGRPQVDSDTERMERFTKAQEYKLKRQMERQQEEEKQRENRIARELGQSHTPQTENPSKPTENQPKEEENKDISEKKKSWYSLW